jgi:hypothetical protein
MMKKTIVPRRLEMRIGLQADSIALKELVSTIRADHQPLSRRTHDRSGDSWLRL